MDEPRDRNGRTRTEHAAWLERRGAETKRIARAMRPMEELKPRPTCCLKHQQLGYDDGGMCFFKPEPEA